eukprot:2694839-Rhodomonas_salina.4
MFDEEDLFSVFTAKSGAPSNAAKTEVKSEEAAVAVKTEGKGDEELGEARKRKVKEEEDEAGEEAGEEEGGEADDDDEEKPAVKKAKRGEDEELWPAGGPGSVAIHDMTINDESLVSCLRPRYAMSATDRPNGTFRGASSAGTTLQVISATLCYMAAPRNSPELT